MEVNGETVEARNILVATGSRASIPPIPGLVEAGYMTNIEGAAIGLGTQAPGSDWGGPLGLEFAQIFARFGSQVTVLEAQDQIVPRAEPEIAAVLEEALADEGITIRTGIPVERVEPGSPHTVVCVSDATDRFEADAILVGTGVRGNTEELGVASSGGRLIQSGIHRDD